MDYSRQIFKMLGVEADEEFNFSDKTRYKIGKDLTLYVFRDGRWTSSVWTLTDILNGRLEITKDGIFSEKAEIVIAYAKACGFKWVAKDKSGTCYFYEEKPFKNTDKGWWESTDHCSHDCGFDFKNISWEDESPYYIGE